MVIDDEAEPENAPKARGTGTGRRGKQAFGAEDPSGAAYLESLVSTDGFTRGQNGKVKFNKDNKRGREREEEMDMGGDDEPAAGGKKARKAPKEVRKLGSEFKAKVS